MSRSTYDFWLLDLDGTLIDVESSYIHEVMTEVGTHLDVSFTSQEAEILWYGLGDTRDRFLLDIGIEPDRFWEVFHQVEDPLERAAATHLYPDAERFVPEIEQPIGLVTHCQDYLTSPVLKRMDIQDWFDTIVCCTDETGWKPDSGPVELAMQDLGVAYNGHEGAMVGDDAQDIGAAWNAGITGIHVERFDPEKYGQCVLGDQRVTSLEDIEV